MSDPFVAEYEEVSSVLLEYGGLVSPWLIGGVWQVLRSTCADIRSASPTDDAGRAAAERHLDALLQLHVLHPESRAFAVSRAITLPHLREFSHLIERAVFHYFKTDFLSSVLVVLPAVEGVLRSYTGWAPGQPDSEWRRIFRDSPARTRNTRRAMYGRALVAFVDNWLFRRTDSADFRLSYLNRHYALHALGEGPYYRAIDCHRMLLFFELFAEMIALEQGIDDPFLPMEDDRMNRRAVYYRGLLLAPPPLQQMRDMEEHLLREHLRYSSEPSPPSFADATDLWAQIMEIK